MGDIALDLDLEVFVRSWRKGGEEEESKRQVNYASLI
jgi:hypothetical protein